MKIDIEKISVKVKVLEDKKTKAIISLDFGDFVVKGFRIQESNYENDSGDKLWLTPPSYQGGPKWHPIFFVPDEKLWSILAKKIWEEYYRQKDEYHKKFFGIKN